MLQQGGKRDLAARGLIEYRSAEVSRCPAALTERRAAARASARHKLRLENINKMGSGEERLVSLGGGGGGGGGGAGQPRCDGPGGAAVWRSLHRRVFKLISGTLMNPPRSFLAAAPPSGLQRKETHGLRRSAPPTLCRPVTTFTGDPLMDIFHSSSAKAACQE